MGRRFLVLPSSSERTAERDEQRIIRGTRIQTKRPWIPIAALLTGSLVWGLIWFPYRVLSAAGLDGTAATLVTYLIPLGIGTLVFRPHLAQLRSNPGVAIAIGLSAGWCNVAYVLAMLHGQVMQVLLLFYLAPLWTVLFALTLLKENPGWSGAMVVCLSSAGAGVMLWRPGMQLPIPNSISDWLAVSAGLTFALSNVLSRRAVALDVAGKSLAIWGGVSVIAIAAMLATPQPPTQWAALSWQIWALVTCVGLVIFAANLVVQEGVTRTGANQAIVILLTELVFAAIAANILAGESMNVRQLSGGILIVTATLLSGRLKHEPASCGS